MCQLSSRYVNPDIAIVSGGKKSKNRLYIFINVQVSIDISLRKIAFANVSAC